MSFSARTSRRPHRVACDPTEGRVLGGYLERVRQDARDVAESEPETSRL